jgi:3-oxoacyl-[acyl-carrier-protein] synthase II
MSRVAVVTGVGIVSGAGAGVERFWEALARGAPGQPPPAGAQAPGRDRAFRMAEAAAREALAGAGLTPRALPGPCALLVGTTLGGAIAGQRWHADLLGGRRPRRADLVQAPLAALADHLAPRLGARGPRAVITNACASGTVALGMALDLVRAGEAELALAGGVDTVHAFNLAGFASLGMLGRGPCVPFDPAGRTSMGLGEAAAFLVIEAGEAAAARGARARAELAGYGAACDAFHATRPRPDGAGAARAIRTALADAAVGVDDVDFVSLHGVGLPQLDAMEAAALGEVFAARAAPLPVASFRPTTGHTLGSVGAVDALACVLAIERGVRPPTGGPDVAAALPPPCRLARAAAPGPIRVALKSSSGFGGVNAALVLRRPEPRS